MIRAIMDYGLMTATGDLEAHGKRIVECGANTVRFVLNYLHNDNEIPNPLTPYQIVGYANEPREGNSVPIRNLSLRYEPFFDRLMVLAEWTKRHGLIPWICFDDRCSWAPGTWKEFLNFWYCNTLSYPGALSGDWTRHGSGGTQDERLNPYRFQLMKDVVRIFRDAGHTLLYGEVENEHGEEPGEAYTLEMDLAWYADQARFLRQAGFDLIIGSARDPITTKIVPFVDIYDVHNINGWGKALVAYTYTNARTTILNTDGADGATPEGSIFDGHTVSIGQAEEIGLSVKSNNGAGFCYLSQLTFKEVICTDLDSTEYAQLEAMSMGSGWQKPVKPPLMVETSMCVKSGKRARADCPQTHIQSFPEGTALPICDLPHPKEEPMKKNWQTWLFGPNSLWVKFPKTTRYAAGILTGLLLSWIF